MIAHLARAICTSREGSTVTEFALLASLIAVALGSTILALGQDVESHYDDVESEYSAVNN